ncbi:MAG TPA: hypothetical protein VGC47_11370 [Acidimicrobiia bacterium]|jgi:hypothetical protein
MSPQQLADLLVATGRAHHDAFIDTDGFDPDWPSWYANHLEEELRLGGYRGTKDELAELLVEQDQAVRGAGRQEDWARAYAEHLWPVLHGS